MPFSRPLQSFLLAQIAVSALPLLLFASFTLGILLVSLLAVLAFSLFWIGLAVLVLVPTLFIAFGLGVCVWLWAVGSYIGLRFAYNTLYAALGTPEIKATVETPGGVTSVSTIPRAGEPKIERFHEPKKDAASFPAQPTYPKENSFAEVH